MVFTRARPGCREARRSGPPRWRRRRWTSCGVSLHFVDGDPPLLHLGDADHPGRKPYCHQHRGREEQEGQKEAACPDDDEHDPVTSRVTRSLMGMWTETGYEERRLLKEPADGGATPPHCPDAAAGARVKTPGRTLRRPAGRRGPPRPGRLGRMGEPCFSLRRRAGASTGKRRPSGGLMRSARGATGPWGRRTGGSEHHQRQRLAGTSTPSQKLSVPKSTAGRRRP